MLLLISYMVSLNGTLGVFLFACDHLMILFGFLSCLTHNPALVILFFVLSTLAFIPVLLGLWYTISFVLELSIYPSIYLYILIYLLYNVVLTSLSSLYQLLGNGELKGYPG